MRVWSAQEPLHRGDGQPPSRWAGYACTTCGSVVTAKGTPGDRVTNPEIVAIFPDLKQAHEDIPATARQYLQQAYETLHAPDAAAVMAGSSVDAMLKALNYMQGSVYTRIEQALSDGVLTKEMAEWAHEVRLGSNRPRHADAENPHVTPAEAKQSVEFAEALGHFLFVLNARIKRGIQKAIQASANQTIDPVISTATGTVGDPTS